jgi:hypothetical protein
MKAILFKTGEDYLLRDMNGDTLGITNGTTNGRKLSKQNCDEIFGVTDVEKLAKEGSYKAFSQTVWINGFKAGFNKAMELNKDKLFTEDDVNLAFVLGKNNDESRINKLINSRLQPTEIDVEVEYMFSVEENGESTNTGLPKLDENGNLILRKL